MSMTSEEKLEPCPFEDGTCDYEALEMVIGAITTVGGKRTFEGYVTCNDCGCRGPVAYANKENIRQTVGYSWNRRASPAPKGET